MNPSLPLMYNRTQVIGGIFGTPFDDHPALASGFTQMLNMTINSGAFIFGFSTLYRLENGTLFIGRHGPSGPDDRDD